MSVTVVGLGRIALQFPAPSAHVASSASRGLSGVRRLQPQWEAEERQSEPSRSMMKAHESEWLWLLDVQPAVVMVTQNPLLPTTATVQART